VRAFLAIEIPGDLRKYLREVASRMAKRMRDIRWVKEEGLHITLKFLGEIDRGAASGIRDAISAVGKDYGPFRASIKGIDAFPNRRKARVVVVGLEEGAETIGKIFSDIEMGLLKMDIQPEEREYSPHITLGRAKMPEPLLEKDIETLEKREFPVERIVLFESTLTSQGAIYTPQWDIKLGG
jgi:RNA 2',3'-cyclic 3'-phosphodiesterase